LFSKRGSNKLPETTDIQIYDENKNVQQIKSFNKHFKKPNTLFENILKEGRNKSELQIKNINCNQDCVY